MREWVPLEFQLDPATRRMDLPRSGPGASLPSGWSVSWNPATGLLSGSFVLRDPHPLRPGAIWSRRVTFNGLFLPGRLMAAGQLLGSKAPVAGITPETVAGLMLLQPVPMP